MIKDKKKKAIEKADEFGKKHTQKDVDNVQKEMDGMKKGPLKTVWDKVVQLWNAFNSPEVPTQYKAMIIGALIYMIVPVDVIPDSIPGAGLADDAFVILYIFNIVKNIITKADLVIGTIKKPFMDEYIGRRINHELDGMIRTSIRNTIISFALLVLGMVLVLAHPFNKTVCYYAASAVFTGSFAWSLYRFINYVPVWFPYALSVIKEKSLKKGIAKEICTQYKAADVYENFINYSSKVMGSTRDLNLENLIDYYIHFFMKKMLIYVISLLLYTVLICFVAKPLLLSQFSDLNMAEIYFYPVIHIIRTFTQR